MRRPLFVVAVTICAGAGLALSACGGSSNNGSSNSNNGGGGGGSGSGFCQQAAQAVSQFAQIGAQVSQQFENTSPGASPDVSTFKSFMQSADSAIDQLDSEAPSAIASSFHTLRQAMDQASSNLQSVSSFDQITNALAPLNTQDVQTASTQVDNYMQQTCGITPEASAG
jgi:hypothetical protein